MVNYLKGMTPWRQGYPLFLKMDITSKIRMPTITDFPFSFSNGNHSVFKVVNIESLNL